MATKVARGDEDELGFDAPVRYVDVLDGPDALDLGVLDAPDALDLGVLDVPDEPDEPDPDAVALEETVWLETPVAPTPPVTAPVLET